MIVVTMKMIAPTIEKTRVIVVPITISVMPTALMTGISVGPGRWISSPAGGACCSASLIGSRVDVDRRGDEGDAEHEGTDGGCDQAGADVLACELAVHVNVLRRDRIPFRHERVPPEPTQSFTSATIAPNRSAR